MNDLAEMQTNPALFARSTRTSRFTEDDVRAARARLDLVPIVENINRWQEIDAGAGGRAPDLSIASLLTVFLMLEGEHAPKLITEVANVFYQRLTPDARELLGVSDVQRAATHAQDWHRWYHRTSRCMQRLLSLVDPWPTRRQLMNAAERAYEAAQLDEGMSLVKRTRLDWLCNALLETTLRELPETVLAVWQGDIGVDQTKVPAVSKRGRGKVKRDAGQRVVNDEVDALVMEMEADWYNHAPESRNVDDPRARSFTWAYAGNLAVMVPPNPSGAQGEALPHPSLVCAMRLSTPVKDHIYNDTLVLLQSLQERGYPAGRITGDKEYFAKQLPENLVLPVRALGYKPVTDYNANHFGLRGTIGGALQVEGQLYCPAMKRALIDATQDMADGVIDEATYDERVSVLRPMYEVHRKGLPGEDGAYPIQCPALGLAPTLTCSIRELHPKAANKARPHVTAPPLHRRDRICSQTSVKVEPDEQTRYLQHLRYGTAEWKAVYRFDRSASERANSIVKDPAKEDLENSSARLTRGFGAAALFTALALVSANRRQSATWLRASVERVQLQRKPRLSPRRASLKYHHPRGPVMNADGTVTLPEEASCD